MEIRKNKVTLDKRGALLAASSILLTAAYQSLWYLAPQRLKSRLMEPELVEEFIAEYHRELNMSKFDSLLEYRKLLRADLVNKILALL